MSVLAEDTVEPAQLPPWGLNCVARSWPICSPFFAHISVTYQGVGRAVISTSHARARQVLASPEARIATPFCCQTRISSVLTAQTADTHCFRAYQIMFLLDAGHDGREVACLAFLSKFALPQTMPLTGF